MERGAVEMFSSLLSRWSKPQLSTDARRCGLTRCVCPACTVEHPLSTSQRCLVLLAAAACCHDFSRCCDDPDFRRTALDLLARLQSQLPATPADGVVWERPLVLDASGESVASVAPLPPSAMHWRSQTLVTVAVGLVLSPAVQSGAGAVPAPASFTLDAATDATWLWLLSAVLSDVVPLKSVALGFLTNLLYCVCADGDASRLPGAARRVIVQPAFISQLVAAVFSVHRYDYHREPVSSCPYRAFVCVCARPSPPQCVLLMLVCVQRELPDARWQAVDAAGRVERRRRRAHARASAGVQCSRGRSERHWVQQRAVAECNAVSVPGAGVCGTRRCP